MCVCVCGECKEKSKFTFAAENSKQRYGGGEKEEEKEFKLRRAKTELKEKERNECFQSAEVCAESFSLSDQVIELQRTDVSITSSYLRLQHSTINLDSVCTGFAVQKLRMHPEVARPTCYQYFFIHFMYGELLESKLKLPKTPVSY